MNEYEKIKKQEIDFLNQWINKKCEDKSEVISLIKSDFVLKNDFKLSNPTENIFTFGKNSLEYSYLRFNHKYNIFNEEKLIGYKYQKNFNNKTIYFNSGMSAITSFIESMCDTGKIGFTYNKDIYFETYKLLLSKNRKFARLKIKYIDAIEIKFNLSNLNYYRDNKVVGLAIDTTCLTELNLDDVINNYLNKGKFVFLLKSFTKLDMFGSEYSRLGALTILTPKNLNAKMSKLYAKFYKNLNERYIYYNCCPSPIDFPPFWEVDKFFILNNERINRIKTNTNIIYNNLKSKQSNIYIVNPNHNLFLLIYLAPDYTREELTFICKEIVKRLNKKYFINYCGSFGFDFISIDTYVDASTSKNTIRLSLNDYDKKTIDAFAKDFWETLNDCI